MHVVDPVQVVHVARVDPDDHHVDDERALRGHVEAEREAEEGDAVQLPRVPAFDVGNEKPDHHQDRRDDQVLAPVFLVLFGQLHAPSFGGNATNRTDTSASVRDCFFFCDGLMLFQNTYKILNPRLKMRAARRLAKAARGTARRGGGGDLRRVLTEDDSALAEALQFSLTQSGHAVDWVPNGAAADEALKDGVFGLLILDLGLPKLDGFEVLRRLRRRNTSLPVLILSGREKPEALVVGREPGT